MYLKLKKMESLFDAKTQVLAINYAGADRRLEKYQEELNAIDFWCFRRKGVLNALIETEKKHKLDVGLRMEALENLLSILKYPDKKEMALPDALVALSMLVDVLDANELLQIFGMAATRTCDRDFFDTFDQNGTIISYVNENDFAGKLAKVYENIYLGYQLSGEVNVCINILCEMVDKSNQWFLSCLTTYEHNIVKEYIAEENVGLRRGEAEKWFVAFFHLCSFNDSTVPYLSRSKDATFTLFKKAFFAEKALQENQGAPRRY